MTGSPWAVVLAGGSGDRVASMTRDASGGVVPKQFWHCDGQPPMVRWAIARARSIAPAPRVLVVVREQHRAHWQPLLGDVPRHNILVQPGNRGTAAGVTRALVEIQARGQAAAPMVLLPADHYVADEHALHRTLVAAVQAARHDYPAIVLLGMSPAAVEDGYGWILPETPDPVARVRRFVEKPPPASAGEMVRAGALINSFMLVARAQALLAIVGRMLPELLQALRHAVFAPRADPAPWSLYDRLPSFDLSRDVLERAANLLSVVRVPACGWSDLGTPERLLQYLEHGTRPRWHDHAAPRTSAAA